MREGFATTPISPSTAAPHQSLAKKDGRHQPKGTYVRRAKG